MSSNAELQTGETVRSVYRTWLTPIAVSLVLIALTSLMLWPLQSQMKQQHLIFVYLVPTSLIAIRYGSVSAMCVVIAGSVAAAYFIYPPHFSFLMTSPLDVLELALFGVLALLASRVVSGFAGDADVAARPRRGKATRRRWLASYPWRGRLR